MLIVLGLAWELLRVTPVQAKLTAGLFLYGTYMNWGVSSLAAAWGTSRLTPLSGAGYSAEPWKETLVQILMERETLDSSEFKDIMADSFGDLALAGDDTD